MVFDEEGVVGFVVECGLKVFGDIGVGFDGECGEFFV